MKQLPYLLLAFLVASAGCSQSKTENPAVDSADSVQRPAAEAILRLPDTCFASVADVKYSIEIYDSMPGGIDDLSALYHQGGNILTFRGNERRDGNFGAKIKGKPKDLRVDWIFTTDVDTTKGSMGQWGGGTGWTGQPLYLRSDSSEVIIVGSLASQVYFIDFNTGKASRRPIYTSNPIKGTVALDPLEPANLYVGHGVPNKRPFGALTIDLRKHQVTQIFPEDSKAPRGWGAYDSSPVRLGQFLFRPGENGRIYKYIVRPGEPKLHSAMSYLINGTGPGIESSMAIYRNYGYTADNHGNILCINLDNLKPIWHYALGDDTDASPVVTVENGKPYVYVAAEVDRSPSGPGHIAKLDALTGAEIWNMTVEGRRRDSDGKHFDGGFYATPLPGIADCSNLIFANVVHNLNGANGSLIAFDRNTGHERYRKPLKYYSWSSPVPVVDEKGRMYLINCDGAGNIYVIRGITGEILFTKHIGSNFESSPIVVGNSIVVGSRGNNIFKLSILTE